VASKKRRSAKPGGKARATSVAPGQVIDATAEEILEDNNVSENPPTIEEADVTPEPDSPPIDLPGTVVEGDEPAIQTPVTEGAPQDPVEVQTPSEAPSDFIPVTLENGTTINADTVMHCATCGARFYAKDVQTEDGSCPATGVGPDGAEIVCGGMLGPVAA
jgi:hypothetical protein